MALGTPVTRGTASSNTSGTTIAMSPSAAIAVGQIAYVWCSADNIATADGASSNHSISDTDGHTWVKLKEWTRSAGVAADGITISLYAVKVTSEIGTADTITITFTSAIVEKVMGIGDGTVAANQTFELEPSSDVGAQGTSSTPSATNSGLTSQEYLFFGVMGRETASTITDDADFTLLNSVSTSGGANPVGGIAETRIATSTGDTYNPTLAASRDWACVIVALDEIAAASDRRGRISWAELETPDIPRRGRVSWAEFEVPVFDRRGRVSWAEMETPNAPVADRRGRVSWAEFEVPVFNRRGRISWVELEVPSLGDQEVEGLPDLTVEIAFASDPGATPVWTDVTTYVEQWSTRRGRQTELDRPEAGTGTLVLNNWDRRFEPENTGSPYSPNVVPMRRIRIRGTWLGITYDVFHGFIEGWPLLYDEGGFQERVSLKIVDAFKVLALAKTSATYIGELSGARIVKILDDAGWPAADRDIDAGKTLVLTAVLDNVPALTSLLDAADAEQGLVFAAPDGKIVFVDRHGFLTTIEDYANHTWGDSGTERAYENIVFDFDDSTIWNDVRITPEGFAEQVVSDVPSQTKYLRRTLAKTEPIATGEALDQARFLLSRYKEVDLRVSQLSLRPQLDPDQWPHVFHHDLSDRVRVRRRPVSGGLIEQDVFIQGIAHDWRPYNWTVTWDLSPVSAVAFWVLDSPTLSVLDSTTKVGY